MGLDSFFKAFKHTGTCWRNHTVTAGFQNSSLEGRLSGNSNSNFSLFLKQTIMWLQKYREWDAWTTFMVLFCHLCQKEPHEASKNVSFVFHENKERINNDRIVVFGCSVRFNNFPQPCTSMCHIYSRWWFRCHFWQPA